MKRQPDFNGPAHTAPGSVFPTVGLAIGLMVVLTLSCSDATGVRIGPPASVERLGTVPAELVAGSSLPDSLVVRVLDEAGNVVPGVAVTWSVTAGGGAASPRNSETNASGEARTVWALGTAAGENTLEARVPNIAPAVFSTRVVAGDPASLVVVSGNHQKGVVGSALDHSLVVRVVDRHGNAARDVGIAWSVTGGGGSVSGESTVTDAAGEAGASWTLGTVAGAHSMEARTEGLAVASFVATATSGAPAIITKAGGDAQEASVGATLPLMMVVQARDEFDNPTPGVDVTWTVLSGGGTISPVSPTTDDAGQAGSRWTLGRDLGQQEMEVRIAGVDPVVFAATAKEPTLEFNIVGVHLNQASQTDGGDIPAVAGRAALLRVVASANETNSHQPEVLLRLYHGATLYREERLTGPLSGVPMAPDLGKSGQTWQLRLDGPDVRPDLRVTATIDPDSAVILGTRSGNRYPSAGSAALDVVSLPPLNVHFIPIEMPVHGATGGVRTENVSGFLEATRQWIPAATINATVREQPLTTQWDLREGGDWSKILAEVQALRTAEGATDQYYHGIVPTVQGMAWGGFAYVPGSPASSARSGITYDRLPGAAGTVAHELGHNFGRWHSPCGNPTGVDASYPHPDARLGSSGYDINGGTLIDPVGNHRDYMSYCGPRWTSDYTYNAILAWRLADPLAQSSAAGAMVQAVRSPTDGTSGLLVWGRFDSHGAHLHPAFTLTSRPTLPEEAGPHQLRGVAADGTELFRIRFAGEALGHGTDPGERHFSYFVPLSPVQIEAVERIELTGPAGSAVQERRQRIATEAGVGRTPTARTQRVSAGTVRVAWDDPSGYPMALIRDPDTGRILSFARGGEIHLRSARDRFEVLLSDGVASRMETTGQ
jgi:hypothetical protein